MADRNFLDIDSIMGLAESMTEFKKEIATILGDAVLGEWVSG